MRVRLLFLTVTTVVLGLGAGELLYRSVALRELAGQFTGRGRLLAIVNEKGIYETDLGEVAGSTEELVVGQNLERLAANETVESAAVDHEIALLEAQFRDARAFRKALDNDGLSIAAIRERVVGQLRALAWLEKQVQPGSSVTAPECRQFYFAHPDLFTQPLRFRVSHLLLAAHAETPPEMVEEKQLGIAVLSARVEKGETLAQLAAEASEDEASKTRGGDLGYFSEHRMPADFMTEIKKLRPGETSQPFRSHLGFHIAQLIEIKSARLLTFDEVRPEISLAIANDRRAEAIARLAATLAVANNGL